MAFIPANIGGGETSTPITPSNSSPVALTANTSVKPTTNGYAIASYDNVTPSSTAVSVVADDIVKIGGSGVIVDAMPPTPASITPSNATPAALTADTPVTPTANGYAIASYSSVTPSNSSPVALTSGDIDKMGGNGYAIESYNSITPSNSSPVSLTANTLVKPLTIGQAILGYTDLTPSNTDPVQLPLLPSPNQPPIYRLRASGYAISSYSSKTPSDTSPASVSSGAIIKASSSGYLVKNTPVNIGAPDVISQANMSGNTSRNITVTKTPRYIIFILVRANDTSGRNYCTCYDVGKDTYTYEYYGGDGYAKTETASGKPSLITTVSSTTVTVNNTVASTCRSHVLIYY